MINIIKSIQLFLSYTFLVPIAILGLTFFFFGVEQISLYDQESILTVWVLLTFIFLVSYVEEISVLFKKHLN